MRTTLIFTLCLIFFTGSGLLRAQTNPNTCFPERSYPVQSLDSEDFSDLKFLKPLLHDKPIVLLGESSHGVGDYYSMKSRLIQYLYQECGYEVIALESGLADIYTKYTQIDSLSAVELRNKTVFANFRCHEIMPLFELIKSSANSERPLLYSGFDSQNFTASLDLTHELLAHYYGKTADSLILNLEKYYNFPPLMWKADKAPLFRLSDTIIGSARALQKLMLASERDIKKDFNISGQHFKILMHALKNHEQAVTLDWNTENPSALRDSLMAENLIWLIQELYPGKKFIVWGHNTHIDKGHTIEMLSKNLGYYLRQRFGEQCYHIGLYAQSGSTYVWWEKSNRRIDSHEADDIEVLTDKYPITFVDFRENKSNCKWLLETVQGYEMEFGRKLPFVPVERYDAIINFREVKAATYK